MLVTPRVVLASVLAAVVILIQLLLFKYYFTSSTLPIDDENDRLSEENAVDDYPVYIQRIFLDKRGKEPLLRVLALNECHRKSILNVQIQNTWQPLEPIPIYDTCPEKYSPGCKLVAYFHEMKVPKNFTQEQVVIRKGLGEIKAVPVEVAAPTNKFGMTVCVAPMYWYSDWTKLIFFIEFWKVQEADDIVIYVHSVTKDVQSLLDYYERKGWITVVQWPALPQTGPNDPNADVFQQGQVLAYNECTLRSNRKYTVYPDLDEVMLTLGDSLYNSVFNSLRDPSLGSVAFPHYAAYFDPPVIPQPFSMEKLDFRGVKNMHAKLDTSRIQKIVARTNAVKRMAVHGISETRNGEREVPATDGLLFHIRYNFNFTANEEQSFQHNFGEYFQMMLQNVTKDVFNKKTRFNPETMVRLGECIDRWPRTPTKCLAPSYCREKMENMETWIEASNSTVTVLDEYR